MALRALLLHAAGLKNNRNRIAPQFVLYASACFVGHNQLASGG